MGLPSSIGNMDLDRLGTPLQVNRDSLLALPSPSDLQGIGDLQTPNPNDGLMSARLVSGAISDLPTPSASPLGTLPGNPGNINWLEWPSPKIQTVRPLLMQSLDLLGGRDTLSLKGPGGGPLNGAVEMERGQGIIRVAGAQEVPASGCILP